MVITIKRLIFAFVLVFLNNFPHLQEVIFISESIGMILFIS
jgi:hypothetical protein